MGSLKDLTLQQSDCPCYHLTLLVALPLRVVDCVPYVWFPCLGTWAQVQECWRYLTSMGNEDHTRKEAVLLEKCLQKIEKWEGRWKLKIFACRMGGTKVFVGGCCLQQKLISLFPRQLCKNPLELR